MLNKNESFATYCGTITDGVKFSQKGKAYDNGGNYLGLIKDGRLVKDEGAEQDKVTPAEILPAHEETPELEVLTANKPEESAKADIQEMNRDELISYAFTTYKEKLKGNASRDALLEQIINLGG